MTEATFFKRGGGLTIREIVALTGARPIRGVDLDRRVTGVATLDRATPNDLAFLDRPKFADRAAGTDAGVCLVLERLAGRIPDHVAVLSAPEPYRAFVEVARALFPGAMRPISAFNAAGVAAGAVVDPSARLESGVTIEPGAAVGPRAEIGAGSLIAANAVIGAMVRIGRDCTVGSNSTIAHALIGDRVVIHPGCSIGQDGFGFIMGARHLKVPQIGRVIVQDDVEIGACTTIDRGAIRDTVIGEGSKIDNMVQIGHNVTIGRHCIIVSQCGISGSTVLEDHVVLGGRVGLADNIVIGEGAVLGAGSGVMSDVPPGEKWMGYPAARAKDYLRGAALLRQMAARGARMPGPDKGRKSPIGEAGDGTPDRES
jgi:UDP-3-O-[3-hydroxymyristoyl] glucosamine N-acyltransferase